MAAKLTTTEVLWGSKSYRLQPFRDGWRIRSRARGDEFDWQFPARSAAKARELALAKFEEKSPAARAKRGTPTLEDVVNAYKEIPKRAGAATEKQNIYCLHSVVEAAMGKKLSSVFVHQVGPDLWAAFQKSRLNGRLDYATRRPGNAAINSTVRCAKSIFIPQLHDDFAKLGIEIPANAAVVKWLPEMVLPKPKALDAEMLDKWGALPVGSAIRDAIGLARFAGLRRDEVNACRRDWIVEDRGAVYIELRDRPEQGFHTKTGAMYRALVVDDAYAAELLAKPEGYIVTMPPRIRSREEWFERKPQEWLRPFVGGAKKPLHRLRGLYADDVAKLTEEAVAARQAGIKAASQALGHTTTKTTTESYLSGS